MSGTRSRIQALLVTASLAGVLALAPAASAQANTPVLISTDGVTYSSTLPAPLFSSPHGMIPRESLTATLYVKNPTNRPVAVALNTVDIGAGASQIASALTVGASARGALSTQVNLGAAGACAPLLAGLSLPANGRAVIDLSLTMADVTGTTAQNQTVSFNVHVSMHDSAVPAPSDACTAVGTDVTGLGPSRSTASGPLAFTGMDPTVPLMAASLLIGVGLAFWLAAARRRRRAEK
jgi:hypothetical protein